MVVTAIMDVAMLQFRRGGFTQVKDLHRKMQGFTGQRMVAVHLNLVALLGDHRKHLVLVSRFCCELLVGSSINLSSHLCNKAKELGGGIVMCSKSTSFIDKNKIIVKDISTKDGPAHQIIPKN